LRILITNKSFTIRGGAELYVRDLAEALISRGHTPIVYTTDPGEVAKEIRALSVPVIDNLNLLSTPPDIIHGQDHVQTLTALLQFPGVPAVFFCHGWLAWEAAPPRFPRLLRYVAIDSLCRDRMLIEHGIPENRIQVLLNFVDLDRFKPRGRLPRFPQRALLFSNYANDSSTSELHEACNRRGIVLDKIGLRFGNSMQRPEEILGNYDLVFAKGRSALEALSVGAAVVLCDPRVGLGPLVTMGEFERLRSLNFGFRELRRPLSVDLIGKEIDRYDADDAAKVTNTVRSTGGRDEAVDRIISLYQDVIAENQRIGEPDQVKEAQAAAAYLRWLAPALKDVYAVENRASVAESEREQLRSEFDQMRLHVAQLIDKERQLERIQNSLGWRLINHYGPIKERFVLPGYRSIRQAFGAARSQEQSSTTSKSGGGDQNNHHQYHAGTEQFAQGHSSLKDIFTEIYDRRTWGNGESISGPGSTLTRTAVFRDQIAALVKDINARTLLDAGCGDFNWMKYVNLDLDRYIGADVVSELISENERKYAGAAITFLDTDVSKDKLPQVDVILSRDCLVHLSYEDGLSAIQNFKQSGSTYLLTTTFASTTQNTDINTGEWRQLNLQLYPFNFPEPLRVIDEHRTHQGKSAEKYLGLWRLIDLPR
jgi:Glycosyltransferase Family 4